MKVIMYSTHCPRCNILEKKLKAKSIEYEEITDIDIISSKGILTVPMLEVDDTLMDFVEANKWINSQEAR